jgi:hypothetical protein
MNTERARQPVRCVGASTPPRAAGVSTVRTTGTTRQSILHAAQRSQPVTPTSAPHVNLSGEDLHSHDSPDD